MVEIEQGLTTMHVNAKVKSDYCLALLLYMQHKSVLSSDIGGVSGYKRFGTSKSELLKHPIRDAQTGLNDARDTIFLLPEPVETEGDVFAFTAKIFSTDPFYFQIWRPVGPGSDDYRYKLRAYRQFTPSVREQFEDVSSIIFLCCLLVM